MRDIFQDYTAVVVFNELLIYFNSNFSRKAIWFVTFVNMSRQLSPQIKMLPNALVIRFQYFSLEWAQNRSGIISNTRLRTMPRPTINKSLCYTKLIKRITVRLVEFSIDQLIEFKCKWILASTLQFMLATMDCPMTTIVLLCLLIGSTLSAPQQAPAPAGAPNAGVLPIALPVHAIRKFNS